MTEAEKIKDEIKTTIAKKYSLRNRITNLAELVSEHTLHSDYEKINLLIDEAMEAYHASQLQKEKEGEGKEIVYPTDEMIKNIAEEMANTDQSERESKSAMYVLIEKIKELNTP